MFHDYEYVIKNIDFEGWNKLNALDSREGVHETMTHCDLTDDERYLLLKLSWTTWMNNILTLNKKDVLESFIFALSHDCKTIIEYNNIIDKLIDIRTGSVNNRLNNFLLSFLLKEL